MRRVNFAIGSDDIGNAPSSLVSEIAQQEVIITAPQLGRSRNRISGMSKHLKTSCRMWEYRVWWKKGVIRDGFSIPSGGLSLSGEHVLFRVTADISGQLHSPDRKHTKLIP